MATTGNNYHTRTDRFNRKKCQDNNKKTEFETTIPLNIINTHSPSLTVPRNRHDAKTNVGSLSENDFVQITTNQQLNIKPIMLKRRLWMFNHHHELHVLRLFYYIPNKKIWDCSRWKKAIETYTKIHMQKLHHTVIKSTRRDPQCYYILYLQYGIFPKTPEHPPHPRARPLPWTDEKIRWFDKRFYHWQIAPHV